MSKETIVKYKNRKMYSTSSSKYVSLQEVYDRFLTGSEFVVTDHETKANITAQTVLRAMGSLSEVECDKTLAMFAVKRVRPSFCSAE
jgi:polyhydroxyalkanoate synthesis regulator protein